MREPLVSVREVSGMMVFLTLHIPSFPIAGLPGEECALLKDVPD